MGYNWAKHNMTHKIKIISLLMVSAMLFFVGCKKNNSENETNETPGETVDEFMLDELIPEEILQLLDSCPSVNYQDPTVFGFNGKSDNPLDNLFAAMCSKAMELTNPNTIYGEGDKEQRGLAYVNGCGYYYKEPGSDPIISWEKDYTIARIGTNSVCDTALFGIDCSGFIAHVMDAAGVGEINVAGRNVLVEMTARQQVDYLKNIKRLRSSHYTGLVKVEVFNNIREEDIKNGDIIYYIGSNNDDHIGMFLKLNQNDKKPIMFQSAGSRKNQCYENKRTHTPPRGPIQLKISQKRLEDYFHISSGTAGLLRITADTNWVDLGLESGILWSTRNAVVNSPEEFGYYITWDNLASAEAEANLAWIEPEGSPYSGIFGCHTPTYEDWKELIDNVPSEWKTQNGVKGRLFTASNGNKLFLPAAGFLHEGNIYNTGQYADLGFFWTSTPSKNNPNNAWFVQFNSNLDEKPVLREYLRLFGLSVRPVRSFP
jgi:uncharacterized protein (TIGR02145 family)